MSYQPDPSGEQVVHHTFNDVTIASNREMATNR